MVADCRHRDTRRHQTGGALRLAVTVSVLAAVAPWVVGCGETAVDPQPPVTVGDIAELTVYVGSTESVDLAGYFSDPNGDVLTYTATTSDAGVATASASASAVTVSGVSQGTADMTVTATDPGGLSAVQAFTVTVRLTERQVLEILYDELDGANWTDNTNWLTDAPLEQWYGVSTADSDGRVDTLRLVDNQLTGEVPPELGILSDLEYLSLDGNSLTGEIPSELGDLSNLEYLSLYRNRLDGEIPPELGNPSSLQYLNLARNELTGEIPPELGELSSLMYLTLYSNQLTGEIPPELADLSNLQRLSLGSNQLTGETSTDKSTASAT